MATKPTTPTLDINLLPVETPDGVRLAVLVGKKAVLRAPSLKAETDRRTTPGSVVWVLSPKSKALGRLERQLASGARFTAKVTTAAVVKSVTTGASAVSARVLKGVIDRRNDLAADRLAEREAAKAEKAAEKAAAKAEKEAVLAAEEAAAAAALETDEDEVEDDVNDWAAIAAEDGPGIGMEEVAFFLASSTMEERAELLAIVVDLRS